MCSVKSRLRNVKSHYKYAYLKVLTPEVLELGLLSSSAEVQGGAEPTDTFQMVIDNIWKQ